MIQAFKFSRVGVSQAIWVYIYCPYLYQIPNWLKRCKGGEQTDRHTHAHTHTRTEAT